MPPNEDEGETITLGFGIPSQMRNKSGSISNGKTLAPNAPLLTVCEKRMGSVTHNAPSGSHKTMQKTLRCLLLTRVTKMDW